MIKYTNYGKLNRINGRFICDEIGQFDIPFGKSLSVFWSFFYIYWDKKSFWFRFFNKWGISGFNQKCRFFVPFSERYGYVKVYKLFGWCIKFLK